MKRICLIGVAVLLMVLVATLMLAAASNNPSAQLTAWMSIGAVGFVAGGRDFLEVMEEADKDFAEAQKRRSGIANFEEKLGRFIEVVANKNGLRRFQRAALLESAATTSDFPILLGTTLERMLLAKYTLAKPQWRSIIATGKQRDFRPSDAVGIFGMTGPLAKVKELGEYKQDRVPGEGKVQIVVEKFGTQFNLSWEDLINDDLGAFADLTDDLNGRAISTENHEAVKLFVASTGPKAALFGNPVVHPIDGSNVVNLGALPFNVDNLGKVCSAMRHQKEKNGEPIVIDGFDVVVPPALEVELWKALNPAAIIMAGTAGAVTKSTSANVVVQNMNITGHVNPYLAVIDTTKPDTTWYVFARSGGMVSKACKMNFLAGHETPEIAQKAPNKLALGGGLMSALEGDFEHDAIGWRVRHCMGGAAIDPRLAYAQVG